MGELAKTIRQWLGFAAALPQPNRQQAARDLLHVHINEGLLEPFLRRAVTPEQHAIVVGHLNVCDPCREAIALVLLAQEDPSAAAELELKRKELVQNREPWQRVAARWTVIVTVGIFMLAVLFLLPETNDPNSRIGRWINSEAQEWSSRSAEQSGAETDESRTSFGALITARLLHDDEERPSERKESSGWFTGGSSGGGTSGGSSSGGDSSQFSAPPAEVPLPQKRERSSQGQSGQGTSGGDGGGFWFFGSEDKPEIIDQPVWDPVLAAKRQARPAKARRAASKRRLVVSPEGLLRRTLDGGATWDVLDVGRREQFRALALSGTTVWAAGANGALYRSPDAAEHWQAVTVFYRGEPIATDINHIRFDDPQHGAFETSDGRVWITVDGGNKWVLSSRAGGK